MRRARTGMTPSMPEAVRRFDQAGYVHTTDPRLILTSSGDEGPGGPGPRSDRKRGLRPTEVTLRASLPPSHDRRVVQHRAWTGHGIPERPRPILLRRPEQRPADDPPDAPPVRDAANPSLDRADRRAGVAPASLVARPPVRARCPAWGTTTSTFSPPTRRICATRSESSSITRRANLSEPAVMR